MENKRLSTSEVVAQAEERLMRTPYEELGPAGRILVDNPRPASPESRRSQMRRIDGEGGSAEVSNQSQLPFLHSVKDPG